MSGASTTVGATQLGYPATVALVTGAGSGIGRATALRLAKDGLSVGCFDLRQAEETVAEIISAGGKAVAIAGDVQVEENWAAAVQKTEAEFGRIGILANVAGYFSPDDSLLSESRKMIDRMLGVNLLGPILGIRAILPAMIEAGQGKIVNVSSAASQTWVPGVSCYAASKAGLEALTGQVAREYGGNGIFVNAMSPGAVDTPLLRTQSAENMAALQARRGRQGLATPDKPADIIAFLASNASDYLNGATLRCGN